MGTLGQYLLRLMAGALIASVIMNLVTEETHRELLRILCGIILLVLIVSPLPGVRWNLDLLQGKDALHAGTEQAAMGEEMARQAQMQRITEALESYILDKAALQGAAVTVNITLGDDLLPSGVEMKGALKSEIRESLSEMMEMELGIAKENQLWTG